MSQWCMLGVCVSIIHQALTGFTGSLMCVCNLVAYVYTHGEEEGGGL